MIKGVIFDLGNTLTYLDTDVKELEVRSNAALTNFLKENGVPAGDTLGALLRAAREDGWRLSEETEIEHTLQEALVTVLTQMGSTLQNGFLARCAEQFFAEGDNHWRPYPESMQALQSLAAHGLRLGLISNADDDAVVQRQVVRVGFAPYLDPVLSSAGGEKWRKPNPRPFHLVAGQWQLPPEDVVMVGDSPRYDILGAHRAGMRGIRIDRNEGHWWQMVPDAMSEDPAIQSDAKISSLLEISDVIGRW